MRYTQLKQLAPCMVATVIAFAAGSATGQGIIAGDAGIGQSFPAPVIADPVIADPIIADPIIADPVIADPIIADPIMSDPIAPISSAPVESTAVDSGSYVGDLTMDGGTVGMIQPRRYGRPDLFYNFYTQGNANRANAQMYLSPLPIPPNVGHTFYTYQPFYPHEMMYWHKNRFHRYYDNGRGMNRTRAIYYSPPVKQALSNVYWNYLRIPR